MKFEEAVEELQKIVKELEDENLPIERAVELYGKGVKLSKVADDILEKAEMKVKQLNG